jgi:hypothetical protein
MTVRLPNSKTKIVIFHPNRDIIVLFSSTNDNTCDTIVLEPLSNSGKHQLLPNVIWANVFRKADNPTTSLSKVLKQILDLK